MAPRRMGLVALVGLVLGVLSGCFAYDAAKPGVMYHNLTDQLVMVTVEGTEGPWTQGVPARGNSEMTMRGCHGTALVVETEEGDPIGRVERSACAGWSLTINGDDSLTYEQD